MLREVIAYSNKDKLSWNIFGIILFSIMFGVAVFILQKINHNGFVAIIFVAPLIIIYFIYDCLRVYLLPDERIIKENDYLILYNKKNYSETLLIKDITDISLNNEHTKYRILNSGSFVIKTGNKKIELNCIKNLEETKSKILSLMLEGKKEQL